MKRLLVAGGIVLAAIVLLVAFGPLRAAEPADAFVDRWLHAVTGDGPADRGWSQLDQASRDQFGNDAEAFRAAAAAEDWSGFHWQVGLSHELESWLSYVYVTVDGGLGAIPTFLRDNQLVAPWCVDDTAPGIAMAVEQQPWTNRTLGAGGLTGSSELALAAGACVQQASIPPEQFLPGGDLVSAGHQLEVWNWTRLPLFLVDEDGRRADLPPCRKVGLDDVARQFEVRAATGYVVSIGLDAPLPGITTYVVIGSRDTYANNAPPAEPMPPCEGEPQVQVGV